MSDVVFTEILLELKQVVAELKAVKKEIREITAWQTAHLLNASGKTLSEPVTWRWLLEKAEEAE